MFHGVAVNSWKLVYSQSFVAAYCRDVANKMFSNNLYGKAIEKKIRLSCRIVEVEAAKLFLSLPYMKAAQWKLLVSVEKEQATGVLATNTGLVKGFF